MPAVHCAVDTRVSPAVLHEANAVLAGIGMNMTDALDMLINTIVRERKLPFDDSAVCAVPNAETILAMEMMDRGEDVVDAKDIDELFEQLES